jgi:indole-3-glycerol phosphate synthase
LIQADLVPVITALNIDLDRFVSAARALGLEPLVEVHSEKVMEKLKGHVIKLPELAKYEQILKSYVAIRR